MGKINYILHGMLIMIVFGMSLKLGAQQTYQLTLDEVVALAQSDAPNALLASTQWKKNYWTYRSFLADFQASRLSRKPVYYLITTGLLNL
jgi:hypothetical protein